ncbi:DUF397 domain-containing protein [Streptomyces sp. NPDC059743]|uniref:DUF397 domain-containing protein n=1 Tax=Streptomyces sp. NPDC059743 TaxID=3346928 RepID=UPI003649A342
MTQLPIASPWRKSSYSNGAGGECVEVADLTEVGVGVRDSKRPQGPLLAVQRDAWAGFVAALCCQQLG